MAKGNSKPKVLPAFLKPVKGMKTKDAYAKAPKNKDPKKKGSK